MILSPYSISSGMYQTYVLDRDGVCHAFGRDSQGERTNMPTSGGWVAVSASNVGGYLLHEDGHLAVFGDRYGALLTNAPDPSRHDYVKVSAANYGAYALTRDGHVEAFGGLANARNVPTGGGFLDVAGGGEGGYAIDSSGYIVPLGDRAGLYAKDNPTGTGFVQVVAGSKGGYALGPTGRVVAFGDDQQSQRDDMPPTTDTFSWLAGGRYFGAGIHSDGSIRVWGANDYGQRTGVPVSRTGAQIVSVEGGFTTAVALYSDGTIARWGDTGTDEDKGWPASGSRGWGVRDPRAIDTQGGVEVRLGANEVVNAEEIVFRGQTIWWRKLAVWPQGRLVKVGANPTGAFASFHAGMTVQWDGTQWLSATAPPTDHPYEWQHARPPGAGTGVHVFVGGGWVNANDLPEFHSAGIPAGSVVAQQWMDGNTAKQWDGTQWVVVPTLRQP
jgi:hypothetical protein